MLNSGFSVSNSPVKAVPINKAPTQPAHFSQTCKTQNLNRYFVAGLIGIQLLALSACNHQTMRPSNAQPSGSWAAHQAQMRAVDQWHIKGKLGYKSPSDAGSVWLDWRQQAAQFTLLLGGPFGAGTVQIFSNENSVTLRRADKPDISASSTKALSGHLLGLDLPVDELSYWMRGIPAPDVPVNEQTFNEQNLAASFAQVGWQLELSKYRSTEAGDLPGKLTATRGQSKFTLLIKEHLLNSNKLRTNIRPRPTIY